MRGMVLGNRESCVYVINEQYEIVYFNHMTKDRFPDIECGKKCYEVMGVENKPCSICPLFRQDKNYSSIFYNQRIHEWQEISSSIIEWPGQDGKCSIVFSQKISKENKNMFYDLTNLDTYDELVEMNLSKGTYRIIFHNEDKYVMPDIEGELARTIPYVVEHMIDPLDQEDFQHFWDQEYLLQVYNSKQPTKARFRMKCQNGEYIWTLQTIVPLSQNDDKMVLCFYQELDNHYEESFLESDFDELTGLYKKNAFFKKVQEKLLSSSDLDLFCLIAIDIDHFKLYNEWYGIEAGDVFLKEMAHYLKDIQDKYHGIAGYFSEDDFTLMLPYHKNIITDIERGIIAHVNHYEENIGFLPTFGAYMIKDKSLPVHTMYDRAVIALNLIKGNYSKRINWYSPKMIQTLEENHKLLSEVQKGIKNNEFICFYQPKCNMYTGKIVGFEALIRWHHPQKGMISPGFFIPFLEKNGFIGQLDYYIWESVCKQIRYWIDYGYDVLPVSVNVSRVDIYSMDIVKSFLQLVQKYDIPTHTLEIEITESAYVEEYDIIKDIIQDLRDLGFKVLMDDFGSGYSSLNMLKDVNVDVLKIDMNFLNIDQQSENRGVGILEAIINMGKLMGLRMIAEGVETKDQVELLLDTGCVYGQGYYYYRPLSIEQVNEKLKSDDIDPRGIQAKQINRVTIKELMNGDYISDTMINNILGGIAFYDLCGDNLVRLSVNQNYNRIIEVNPVDLEEGKSRVLDGIHVDDRESLLKIFYSAYEHPVTGAKGVFRFIGGARMLWIQLETFFLREQDGHRLYYGHIEDVTEQKEKELRLESSQKALSAVIQISDNDSSMQKLTKMNRHAAETIFAQFMPNGMIGGYCEEGFPLYFANEEMIKLLGYDDYDEFSEAIHGLVINTIHPDDRGQVSKDLGDQYYVGLEYTTTYRMPKKDGTWFWTMDKGRVVEAEDGRLAIVSACTDISDIMNRVQELTDYNKVLLEENQEFEFFYNQLPSGYHRCANTPDFDFLYISNRFLEIFGYTREEIKELFDNKYINMVHPDDRDVINGGVKRVRKTNKTLTFEYRMKAKDGYIWVIDQTSHTNYHGTLYYQGVVLDVTETVNLRNKMQMLEESLPENILLINYSEESTHIEVITQGLFRSLGYENKEVEDYIAQKKLSDYVENGLFEKINDQVLNAMSKHENFSTVFEYHDNGLRWLRLELTFMEAIDHHLTYMGIITDITSVKQQEDELRLGDKKLQTILDLAHINYWEWDMKKHPLTEYTVNEILNTVLKIVEEDKEMYAHYLHKNIESIKILTDYEDQFKDYVMKLHHNQDNKTYRLEIPIYLSDNELIWIRLVGQTICDENHQPIKIIGYYINITQQKNDELQNKENLKVLEAMGQEALHRFKVSLLRNKIIPDEHSKKWIQDSPYTFKDDYNTIAAYYVECIVAKEMQEEVRDFSNSIHLYDMYKEGRMTDSCYYQRLYNGEYRWVRMIVEIEKSESLDDIYAYFYIIDVDEQKKHELYLTQLAQTDSLSGLYNRNACISKIESYLSTNPSISSFIMIDFDNFKLANDVFGHDFGDELIRRSAKIMTEFFGPDDIIGRIGGDEFIVLYKNDCEMKIHDDLKQLQQKLSSTHLAGNKEICFTVSMGYVLIPQDGNDFKELYRKADIALFAAKSKGKNICLRYDDSMSGMRIGMIE